MFSFIFSTTNCEFVLNIMGLRGFFYDTSGEIRPIRDGAVSGSRISLVEAYEEDDERPNFFDNRLI